MYKLNNATNITRTADNASIPNDPANRDYAEYLDWLAAGNTPLPADPLPNPRLTEIPVRLAAIDLETIRALRVKAVGKDKPADNVKLAVLETEAEALRAELASL